MAFEPLTYESFLKSLKENKVHFVSEEPFDFTMNEEIVEPVYAIKTSGSVESKVFLHKLTTLKLSCQNFFKTFELGSSDRW